MIPLPLSPDEAGVVLAAATAIVALWMWTNRKDAP